MPHARSSACPRRPRREARDVTRGAAIRRRASRGNTPRKHDDTLCGRRYVLNNTRESSIDSYTVQCYLISLTFHEQYCAPRAVPDLVRPWHFPARVRVAAQVCSVTGPGPRLPRASGPTLATSRFVSTSSVKQICRVDSFRSKTQSATIGPDRTPEGLERAPSELGSSDAWSPRNKSPIVSRTAAPTRASETPVDATRLRHRAWRDAADI